MLSILDRRTSGGTIGDHEWKHLFSTDPYRRLKQREASLERPFTDEAFREFLLSDDLLLRAQGLRRTIDEWRSRDLEASAHRVLRYLPSQARIRATVYPVIKPQSNSFVFDVHGDPAIFLYLDPSQSGASFENTVAHEMHHIGFASVVRSADTVGEGLSARARLATAWMAAFGEGFAMLAAAGGPEIHPHASSSEPDRERWDRAAANFDDDLRTLDAFFLEVIDGRLTSEEAIRKRALSFFGVQGPWYTVGYRMAVVVEERYGRETLIECMLEPRRLLPLYNAATRQGGKSGPLWSDRLLRAIGTP